MLLDINKALSGLPNEMVPALKGHNNPNTVNACAMLHDARAQRTSQLGAAIGYFISACKRNLGRTA